MSLSYYGKRPGPGMRLQKLSMQFDTNETATPTRCSKRMSGSSTTRRAANGRSSPTADGIERLWEVAAPLLESPPDLEFYEPGSYGPEERPRAHRTAPLAAPVRAEVARIDTAQQSRVQQVAETSARFSDEVVPIDGRPLQE